MILTDQFGPPRVGFDNDCVPLAKFQDPSFEHFKEFLLAQKKHGFMPPPGTLCVVSAISLLCKVGCERFFVHLDQFESWLMENFQMKVMPTIFPFPNNFAKSHLISIHQFLTVMEARSAGDLTGTMDLNCSLWKPLESIFSGMGAKKVILPTPPICAIINNEEKTLSCTKEAWEGLAGFDFSFRIPPEIEKNFLASMFGLIENIAPPSLKISVPSLRAIERGSTSLLEPPPPSHQAPLEPQRK